MRLPSLLLIATALATAAYGAADIEYVPDDYSNVLVEVEARNPEPSSLTDLSASVRAGVTFPLTSSVVVPNVQYTATFQLAQTNNWTAVSLNLWLMQEKEYFVTQLRPQLPVQNIINAATLQGSIVFDVTAEVCGTGPIYFMKVEGVDGVGATYDLPNSQLFPIFDPSAGSWSSPAPSTTLHAGRTVTLSYKLSSQFNQVKTVRIELAAATMKQSFIILDNVPVTPNAQSNEIVWNVPIVFLTGSFYYFRVIPNDGPDSFSDNTEAGLPVTGFSLPSFGMNLQQNVPSIQNPFINVTAPNATVTTGRLYNITWTYSGSGTVSNWFVDLYTVGPASANYTSGRIANITDGSMSFRWNATRTTYWDGLYYLRVYGYMDGTPVAPDVDPISGVSGWFNVVNPGWEPVLCE
ncbi:hypothetical protein HK101_002091 [Irineochytrium annulatum]|nr:hypothetical protein HK101_002091 [Irineochytrium annulatum]